MNAEFYRRFRDAYHRAFDLSGKDLDAFLDELGRTDPELRHVVTQALAGCEDELPGEGRLLRFLAGVEMDGVEATDRTLPDIPGYQIISLINRGGMGFVYKALSEKRRLVAKSGLVALKVPSKATTEILSRFRCEVERLKELDHPFICKLFDYKVQGKQPYFFAMEYVEGTTLAAL